MDNATFSTLIKMNKDFYKNLGKDFSKTRQLPWEGWNRVVNLVKDKKTLSILDLGCGNGRFYKFLKKELPNTDLDYLGVDSTESLLEEAKELGGKYRVLDVITELDKIKTGLPAQAGFDLVTIFGLAHHIPSQEFRKGWFGNLAKLIKPQGILVLTFWDFQKEGKNARFNLDLEEGDYLLGWDNTKDTYRYCHKYSEGERRQIEKILQDAGLNPAEQFKESQNIYLVFIKS